MMEIKDWQEFVDQEIPIVHRSQFSIIEVKPGFSLVKGAIKDHSNDKGTAFGGSIASIATLCAWLAVKSLILDLFPEADVWVKQSKIQYHNPLIDDFYARSRDIKVREVVKMKSGLKKQGKATIKTQVDLFSEPYEVMASFEGEYVILK